MLERKTPLKRTPLKRGAWNRKAPPAPPARRPIRPKSRKRAAMAAAYAKLRARLVEAPDAKCVACGGKPTDLHHRREMSMGGAYTNPQNTIPVCRQDHEWIHRNTRAAQAKGWLVFEGDPEFEELGARVWRMR